MEAGNKLSVEQPLIAIIIAIPNSPLRVTSIYFLQGYKVEAITCFRQVAS